MPTNQQRREAAKRKLERQLVRRQQQERRRRQRLLVVGVVAAVIVVSGAVWLIFADHSSPNPDAAGSDATASLSSAAPTTPCSYPAGGTAAKPVSAPDNLSPLNSGTVSVEMTINGSAVPMTLDRAGAPCGVNAFLSLAQQGFYNDTTCWRLTRSAGLNVLQCGDPSGQGNGGPGFSFADEPPRAETDPTTGQPTGPTSYPVGTVALANAGTGSSGSQFFIVYGDSPGLSADYTVLGKIDGNGMDVIQQIAAGGTADGAQDGAPATTATISQVVVPGDALEGSGTYTSSAAPSDDLGTGLPSDPGATDSGAAPTDGSTDPGATATDPSAADPSAAASVAETTPVPSS